jgi:hypothetical protein
LERELENSLKPSLERESENWNLHFQCWKIRIFIHFISYYSIVFE